MGDHDTIQVDGSRPAASRLVASSTTKRLTKSARREQLLDIASEVLIERGLGAITMEGLAARAGVSKAIPYRHFENADAVLVTLYRRETLGLAERILGVIDPADPPETRMRAAIHAYFDVVIERGAILAILAGPGSSIPQLADGRGREGHGFVARLLRDQLGVPDLDAPLAASLLIGTLNGATDALAHRVADRAAIEARVLEIGRLFGVGREITAPTIRPR